MGARAGSNAEGDGRPRDGRARESGEDNMSGQATDAATEAFFAHRDLLFTIAYEMLGSAADAEDVLQETWLRWVEVEPGRVDEPRAYLVRIVTRQSLNRLRAVKRRREAYVGQCCPSRCSPRPTWPRTSSSPRACRWRCWSCWRRWRRPSGPSSCCARCSARRTRRSRRRWARARTRSGRSRTGPAVTSTPAARAGPPRRARCGRRRSRCGARSRPGICRACSTCSPRTWCG